MNHRDEIREIFYQTGFSDVGFTHPRPLEHFPNYSAWIGKGLHAGMGYLAEPSALERRANPESILPGTKTVAVLAVPYANPDARPQQNRSTPQGRIAAYAWGTDYHEIIPPRLRSAQNAIEKLLGKPLNARGYTDTGPVLERSFAQRAGLGWSGKNTCLIIPGKGSYFLLAEMFLPVEVEPDVPFQTDQCGSCTRCISACPTACIRSDRTIDSGRCTSYLTIENKGAIPPELREPVGDWVFGCDICQQVCPWNIRFATQAGDPALANREDLPSPNLITDLALTPHEFNLKFRHTPLTRAKRRGYLRNIAVALGNIGDPGSDKALAECLHNEPEPLVRAHAAWALGQLKTLFARKTLADLFPREVEVSVRVEIEQALQLSS
jgi:epoxyqueuosine reductase